MSTPTVSDDGLSAGGWWLWRQDDNANVLFVARFGSRVAAEEARCRCEVRGHRQVHWATAAPDLAHGCVPEHPAAEAQT